MDITPPPILPMWSRLVPYLCRASIGYQPICDLESIKFWKRGLGTTTRTTSKRGCPNHTRRRPKRPTQLCVAGPDLGPADGQNNGSREYPPGEIAEACAPGEGNLEQTARHCRRSIRGGQAEDYTICAIFICVSSRDYDQFNHYGRQILIVQMRPVIRRCLLYPMT